MATLAFITLRWLDVIDILLVAVFLYYLYSLVRGTVAMRIMLGLLLVLIFWRIAIALQMELIADIIGSFISIGAIAFVVIFQPELRKFLIRLGSSRFTWYGNPKHGWIKFTVGSKMDKLIYRELSLAIQRMTNSNTGAIIVLQRAPDLDEVINTGIRIDARISAELIESIFHKNNPLHDGAMIIGDNRIIAAACVLPNSDRKDLPKHFGLRHRAAIGLSENSNALIITLSEETGEITFVENGRFIENISIEELQDRLEEHFG